MLMFLDLPSYINAEGEPVAELPPDGNPTPIRSRTAQEFIAKIYFNTRNTYIPERAIKRVQLIWAGWAQEKVMPPLTVAEQRLMSALDDREPLVQTVFSFMNKYSEHHKAIEYEGLTSDLRKRLAKVATTLGYRSARLPWSSNAISLGKALRRVELPLYQLGLLLFFEHTKMGTKVILQWQNDPNQQGNPGGGSGNLSPQSVTPNPIDAKDLERKVTKVRDPNALRPQSRAQEEGKDGPTNPD